MDEHDPLNLDFGALFLEDESESEAEVPPGCSSSSDGDYDSDPSDPPNATLMLQPVVSHPSRTSAVRMRVPAFMWENHDGDQDVEDRPLQHPHIDITEMVPPDVPDDINPADSGFVHGHVPSDVEVGLLAGKSYPTWAAFDEVLDNYEAKAGWRFVRVKRDKERLVAQCRGADKKNPDSCKAAFTVRFLRKSGRITIRTSHLIHTCPQGLHKWRHGAHRRRWVEGKVESSFRVNSDTSNKTLQGFSRETKLASTTKHTVQRARVKVVKGLMGDQATYFQKICSYVEKVATTDVGTHIQYQTYRLDKRFRCVYCSPASSQHAFDYVRPFVGFDATHSGGEFPMIVLLATTFDCNNHILLLAWAVVGNKTKVNWIWFCELFAKSYPRMRSCKESVIVSDRDKGLKEAVELEWGSIYHSFCTRHLRANVITNSDKTIGDFFFNELCRQVREADFTRLLDGYKPLTAKQQEGLDYIKKIDPKLYSRFAFPTPRWGHTTSNVVEILNGVIRETRRKPTLNICKELWDYTTSNHFQRLQTAMTWPKGENALTQHAHTMLNVLYAKAGGVEERPSSETSALMCDTEGEWAIDMEKRICECRDWQEMGFPCVHAIKFCVNRGWNEKLYIDNIWKVKNQVEAYKAALKPISLEGLVLNPDCKEPLNAPSAAKVAKSNKRKASRFEQVLAGQRLAAKQHQKCGTCKQEGHNTRRCPVPLQRAEVRMGKDADYLRVCAIHTMTREQVGERWIYWDSRPTPKLSFSQWYNEMYPISQEQGSTSATHEHGGTSGGTVVPGS